MFDFFDILLGYVEFFFQYLFSLVDSLVHGVLMLLVALQLPTYLGGLLPGILGTACMVTTAILTIRFLCLK